MALNTQLSDTAANASCAAITALADNGYVRVYDAPQPANANTGITTQNMLAELRFGADAFNDPSAGAATAKAIATVVIARTGTAAWFRVLESNGSTVLWDGTAGESGDTPNMVLNSKALQINANLSVTSLTFTAVEAGS